MCVAVRVFETGFVHMRMSVLGSVLVGVGVLVADMVMLVRGVRMCMSLVAMVVFVGVRRVMGVQFGHGQILREIGCACGYFIHPRLGRLGRPATAFRPPSPL